MVIYFSNKNLYKIKKICLLAKMKLKTKQNKGQNKTKIRYKYKQN